MCFLKRRTFQSAATFSGPLARRPSASQQGDIRLAFCRSCGHVYNTAFDPARLTYSASYDNSLHFSPRFQEYARELAADLVERYALHGKTVIEIGCGNAEFLSLLCRLGPNRGIGFDPSFIPNRADLTSGEGIEIIADEYSERYSDLSCDLLCSRHMLEHVPESAAQLSTPSAARLKKPRAQQSILKFQMFYLRCARMAYGTSFMSTAPTSDHNHCIASLPTRDSTSVTFVNHSAVNT